MLDFGIYFGVKGFTKSESHRTVTSCFWIALHRSILVASTPLQRVATCSSRLHQVVRIAAKISFLFGPQGRFWNAYSLVVRSAGFDSVESTSRFASMCF